MKPKDRTTLAAARAATVAAGAAVRAAEAADRTDRREPEARIERPGDVELDLLGALEQLPQGAVVDVFRVLDNGERAWCCKMDAADFTLESVAERLKVGGRFKAFFRKPTDRGGFVMAGTRNFTLDPAVFVAAPPAPAPAARAGVAELEEVQTLLRTHAELSQAMSRSALENASFLSTAQAALMKSMVEGRGGSETGELIVKLIGALAPILAPLLADRGKGGGLTPEFMMQLVDRVQGRAASASSPRELLEVLRDARELLSTEAPPAWLPVAEKVLGLAERGIERMQPRARIPAAAPPTVLLAPAPAPTNPVPPAPAAGTLEARVQEFLSFLEPAMPELIRHATRDHDPATYAGMLVDQIPEGYDDEIRAVISRPEFLGELAAHFPELSEAVRPWFAQLLAEVKTLLAPEPAEPAPPEATP